MPPQYLKVLESDPLRMPGGRGERFLRAVRTRRRLPLSTSQARPWLETYLQLRPMHDRLTATDLTRADLVATRSHEFGDDGGGFALERVVAVICWPRSAITASRIGIARERCP